MIPPEVLARMAGDHRHCYACEKCEVRWSFSAGPNCWVCGRFGRKR